MKVFGIDIIRGSVRSRTRRPLYALIKLVEDEEVFEGQVSLHRLIRLLSDEEPDILAVDSLQEIAADQQALFSFIQALPPATRLVQVTGGERKESLGKVAGRYNLRFNKSDPYAEARVAARVASLGAGAEVIAFENSCDIIVSRRRSIGKGGWSQNRYVRKIHRAVLERGRMIEQSLTDAGLPFEMKEFPALGGARRTQFHVMVSRDMVPVSSYQGADVQVKISGRRLDRIQFRPLHGRPRYLIVGIDPGTTIGIAAIDLDGNLAHVSSSRQMTMADVREELIRIGKPLIIASDVAQMPFTVEKIRRAFNAVAYTPRQDRTQEEKTALTEAFSYANDHERDALAAAIDAFRQYRNKFQNIAKRVPPGSDLDEIRAGFVRGLSVEQALAGTIVVPASVPATVEEAPGPEPRDEQIAEMEGTVKRLREYVHELQGSERTKDAEIARLKARIEDMRQSRDRKVRRDTEVTKLNEMLASQKLQMRREQKKVRNLTKRVDRLKRFADLQMAGEYIPVKVAETLSRETVRNLDNELGLGEGDIVMVLRPEGWGKSVIEMLVTAKIRALVVWAPSDNALDRTMVQAFRNAGTPLISSGSVGAQVRGKTGSILREALEKAIAAWISSQQQYEREKKTELIESIFEEYQTERKREAMRNG
jgi:predicted RNase H-like nuclease (RuvC/YqgF family)